MHEWTLSLRARDGWMSMRTTVRMRGFTLIERMIVVAIVGILSATAIPNSRRFQLRSKSSEAKVNQQAIRTADAAADLDGQSEF